MSNESPLRVPEQGIPAPMSLSPQARAYLVDAALRLTGRPLPSKGGGAVIAEVQAAAEAAVQFLRPLAARFVGTSETIELPSGANLYRLTPKTTGAHRQGAYFDIHGGGFVSGGGEMCQLLAKIRACDHGMQVFAVDYRLLPLHPFPAGLEDCVASYRTVLSYCPSDKIVMGGASAGGNLAAALILRARESGLPLPAALILQTPALDMTESGDSHQTNRYLDVNLYGGAGEVSRLYAANVNPADPHVSPLFADFTKGWPRTLLTTGTRDLLLSDTVRMHRALRRVGVSADLHVAEASPHGGFMGANAPEDLEIIAECRRFARKAWGIDM